MWPNPQETADLVTFTEENLNGKLHFCAVYFACAVSSILQAKNVIWTELVLLIADSLNLSLSGSEWDIEDYIYVSSVAVLCEGCKNL